VKSIKSFTRSKKMITKNGKGFEVALMLLREFNLPVHAPDNPRGGQKSGVAD
jgi:hypothetical protein